MIDLGFQSFLVIGYWKEPGEVVGRKVEGLFQEEEEARSTPG